MTYASGAVRLLNKRQEIDRFERKTLPAAAGKRFPHGQIFGCDAAGAQRRFRLQLCHQGGFANLARPKKDEHLPLMSPPSLARAVFCYSV